MSNSRWSGLVVGVIVSAAAAMTVAVACSSQDSGSEAREGEQRGNSSDRLIQAPPNAGVVTVAGPTAAGASGGFVDNAVATLGKLNDPAGVAVAADGTIYVADWGNNAVRRITPGGALETLLKAETPNAVKNPRSEEIPATPTSPPPQWTVVSGTWRSASKATCSSCGDSFDGSRWFGGTGGELRQDVDLTAYQNNPAFGGYYLAVDARLGTGATARVKLESLNAAGDVVAVREDLQLGGATWQHTGRIGSAPPPPKARITLIAAGSTGAEAYFDAVQLRVLDSSVPWPISGMHGLSSVAITSTGGLLVGASDVYSMTTSGGSQAKILSTPGVVSSIAPVSDGYAYFVDSTQRDLYVRSNTGVNYRAFVDGEANGEPLAVVATVQGSGHRLWVTFRRYYNIYAYDCPKSTTANATVTCTFANVRFGGSKGFAPDMDGTAGGERFSNPHSIALGKFGDILIADEGNHAILRGLLPLTQISAGTGVLGFKDGASNQAQFWSPSGVAAAPDGSIVVADRMNNRIRKILCAATNVCAASGNSCPIAPTNDNNTCTTDSCMVLAVRNEPLANGASCNDSSACTTSDVCSAGVCSGTPVPTDDQLLCTVDSCDPASGPVHTPKTFTDPNTTDCLVPVCDPATGNAKTVPAAEGTSCAGVNSGRFCDHASVCEATPAPTFTAPTLDASTGTDFTQLTNGIWNGTGAIQTGVTTSIEVGRAGWLIGQVKTAAGNALPNVEVTIAGDATYGKTFTRGDGRFDFIVNGGRSYTVRFQKAGHLPSDRQVYVGWEETSVVKDVILLTVDPVVTTATFGANGTGSTTFQVASGSTTTDLEGTRTGKLMLPKGLTAKISNVLKPSLNLRITEYTVGSDGPARMPAPLPPTSAYTYAFELSADEAIAAGATSVQFSAPAYYYVDNFISDPTGSIHPSVGSKVPAGYYDRDKRAWIPSQNGIVIKVLKGKQSIASGAPAEIDVTGDGSKDVLGSPALTGLSFTNEEFIALREYDDGKTLWRVPIDHMTPWDLNFATGTLCDEACAQPLVNASTPGPLTCSTSVPGSVIGCESQTLGETFAVAGTPFALNYDSGRLPLYSSWRTMTMNIRAIPPPNEGDSEAASVRVAIAGKVVFSEVFYPGPAKKREFKWDGLDAFGRAVVGSATATIDSRWFGQYRSWEYTEEFGRASTAPNGTFRSKIVQFDLERRDTRELPGSPPIPGKGSWSLGGWTLSPHHFYDVKSEILYEGSGRTRKVDPGLHIIKRMMGSGGGTDFAADNASATTTGTGVRYNSGIAVAPNGDIYYSDEEHSVIRRVNSKGEVRTIAGKFDEPRVPGSACIDGGDGGDSVVVGRVGRPRSFAFGRDGELYFYDPADNTIRVLRPSGPDKFVIDTVAGVPCERADPFLENLPALGNPLPGIYGFQTPELAEIAVGPDGAIYFGDRHHHKIRRFAVGGKVITVAGGGGVDFERLDGAVATGVGIGEPIALAVGMDGSVYASNAQNLYKITPEGRLKLLSANHPDLTFPAHPPLENVPSSQDYVSGVTDIAVGPDGTVVYTDAARDFTNEPDYATAIRQIDPDGTVRTISRGGIGAPIDGAAAIGGGTSIGIGTQVAIAPNGSTFVSDHNSIYRISTGYASPTTACADSKAAHLIPSGDEAFCFDKNGRHLSTVNWRTGKKLLTFDNDLTTGRLNSITDANGLQTKVAFAGGGYTITAPRLQATTITTNVDGNAAKIKDDVAEVLLSPSTAGHLDDLTDRNGNKFVFSFENGLLESDRSPLSLTPQYLERSDITDGFRVTHTTPLGRVTKYDVTRGTAEQSKSTITFPDLTQRTRTHERDGTMIVVNPDGTQLASGVPGPDPIWGFKQPIPGKRTFTLPAGTLSMTTSEVTCPLTTSGLQSTQFSAIAQNPTKDLACNKDVPADPLADKVTPSAFSNPPHSATKRVWDTTGETITRTSPAGRIQTQKRDAKGRIVSTQIGSLTPVLYTYDSTVGRGDQLTFIRRGVRQTKLEYRSKDELDPTTQLPYNDVGFVKRITDALGYATDLNSDIFGRPKKVEEAVGAGTTGTNTFEWDGNGNLKLVKPPGRPNHALRYNSVNRLDLYTPPTVVDVQSPATTLKTTDDRMADTETRPDGVVIQPTYVTSPTSTGQLDKITFSGGSSPSGIVDYEYYQSTDTNYAAGQAPGKVKSIAGPYGTTQLKFTYNGSLPTAVSWNKVLSSAELPASVDWGYNPSLFMSRETVSPITGTSLARFFGYDADNLLTCNSSTSTTTCASLGPRDLKLSRSTEHGAITGLNFGGLAKLAESWDYSDSAPDAGGQVDTDGVDKRFGELRRQFLGYGDATTKLAEIVYDAAVPDARDAAGRIVTKTEAFPGTAAGTFITSDIVYGYDERGRLESVIVDGLDSEEFGYDANGNRTSFIPGTGTALIGTYDNQDRLAVYGTTTTGIAIGDIKYSYGKNGELAERDIKTAAGVSTWTYTYDALGNLITVVKPGAPATTYTYLVDGVGRRIGKKEKIGTGADTVKKRWLYRDQLSPVAELTSTGALAALYIYGSRRNTPDLVIKPYVDSGGVTQYKTYRLFSDQLGSPRLAVNVDDKNDIPYRVDYSAFGVPNWKGTEPSTGLPTPAAFDWIPFGFAGGMYDKDTGLVRFGARDYDASVGRWVSKDPILFGGRQANLYVYVGNDPVNRRDPTGLVAGVDDAAIVGGAAILLTGAAIYGILANNPAAVDDTINWIKDGLGKVKDKVTDICNPSPAPPPDCGAARSRCAQACVEEGMLEVNKDLGGNWGFEQCIKMCMEALDC